MTVSCIDVFCLFFISNLPTHHYGIYIVILLNLYQTINLSFVVIDLSDVDLTTEVNKYLESLPVTP